MANEDHRHHETAGDREERHHDSGDTTEPAWGHQQDQQRPEEIELLLHRQRPGVLKRVRHRMKWVVEVERVAKQTNRVRGAELEDEQAGDHGEIIDREDAQCPAHIEILERDASGLGALAQQQAGDEEARNHEEDIKRDIADARQLVDVPDGVVEAALQHLRAVSKDHHYHADPAKTVEGREFSGGR